MIMETLEDKITIEYYRLAGKLGFYPSYLHVHPSFVNKMISKYYIYGKLQINEKENTYKYMGMTIKRSLDIKEDDFLLSFDKYEL